jgi:hypothetical protein
VEKLDFKKKYKELYAPKSKSTIINVPVMRFIIVDGKQPQGYFEYVVTPMVFVQMMHIGPYSQEPASVEQMRRFMKENNLEDMTGMVKKHHEIYLSDPRKVEGAKLNTILRHPVDYIR